jgi:hypothetical protein
MGNISQLGGTVVELTLTFSGLASDANLLAGRQSTSTTFADTVTGFRVSGWLKTGSSAPTAGRACHFYWVQKIGDNSTEANATWPSLFGDSDANVSILNTAYASTVGRYLGCVEVTAATATVYGFNFAWPASRAQFSRIGCLWVVHDWGQVPDTTATNHKFYLEPYSSTY